MAEQGNCYIVKQKEDLMDNKITIICPGCRREISIDEALKHQLIESEKLKVESEYRDKLEAEKRKLWAAAQERIRAEGTRLKAEGRGREKEIFNLRQELETQREKRAEAEAMELRVRKEKVRLEEARQAFELEKQRQLDAERNKIREEAVKAYTEERRLKEAENAKLITDMRHQIEVLKRKAEQGSEQIQGEVLELELEELLKSEFPLDEVLPVPKGITGADIIQKIRDQRGRSGGTIVWELKRTKAWSESWVQKLKDDQRKVRAEAAILVSTVLPAGMIGSGIYNSIYVAQPKMALSLGRILRQHIIRISAAIMAREGKSEQKEMLYHYLCGSEFRGRIEAFIESSISLKESLEREKRAYTKIWAEREKQIERIGNSMSGLYGDIKGIAGQSLPEIKSLELPASDATESVESEVITVIEEAAKVDNRQQLF